jgi:hypothetical protein
MVVQFEVFGHGDKSYDCHPGSPEISSLWRRFSRLEEQNHALGGAQPGDVFEAFLVF